MSSAPEYVLGVTDTTLDFLENLSKGLPIPVTGVISAVKGVIAIVQVGMSTVSKLQTRIS